MLDVSLRTQCDGLKVGHEFQEPFGEDIADDLDNINKALDGGILSTETAVEMNPLVKDPVREMERLTAEQAERLKQQQSIFGDDDGAGPQSFSDGEEEDDDDAEDGESKKKKDDKGKNLTK